MSAISRQVSSEVAGTLGTGLMAAHMGLSNALDGIQQRRQAAADSVSVLALRLREARRDQRAAVARADVMAARAVTAERELVRLVAEAAQLRAALHAERELSAGLRDVLGV